MRLYTDTKYLVEEYINDYGWSKARTFTQKEGESGLANNAAKQLCDDTKHKTRVIKVISYTELVNELHPG